MYTQLSRGLDKTIENIIENHKNHKSMLKHEKVVKPWWAWLGPHARKYMLGSGGGPCHNYWLYKPGSLPHPHPPPPTHLPTSPPRL
jgi:hypothetical protein